MIPLIIQKYYNCFRRKNWNLKIFKNNQDSLFPIVPRLIPNYSWLISLFIPVWSESSDGRSGILQCFQNPDSRLASFFWAMPLLDPLQVSDLTYLHTPFKSIFAIESLREPEIQAEKTKNNYNHENKCSWLLSLFVSMLNGSKSHRWFK